MKIEIQVTNRWNMPKGITGEAVEKGLLWIENKKRSRISREFPDGWIRNEEIVAEGMQQGSDVWPLFWHDDETIREHYLHNQANYLAGCYKATVIYDDGTTIIQAPANVIVRPTDGERYFQSPGSVSDADNRKQVLGECIGFLKAAQSRLAKVQGSFLFSERIIEAIGRLIDQVEKAANTRKKATTKRRQNQPTA